MDQSDKLSNRQDRNLKRNRKEEKEKKFRFIHSERNSPESLPATDTQPLAGMARAARAA